MSAKGDEYSDRLRAQGFKAGDVVYEMYPDFSIGDVLLALFGGTYSRPRVLELDAGVRCSKLQIVVDAVRRIDVPLGAGTDFPEHPEYPEWQVEGRTLCGPGPFGASAPVRIYLMTNDLCFDVAYVQLVAERSDGSENIRSVAHGSLDEVCRSRDQSPAQ